MDEVEREVDRLVEEDPPRRTKSRKGRKPWRDYYTFDRSKERIPGGSTALIAGGDPWMIKVYTTEKDLPQELYAPVAKGGLDLHTWGTKDGFIGWIGGTITKGGRDPRTGKEKRSSLFVSEAQSDLVQKTVMFTSREAYEKRVKARLAQVQKEFEDVTNELQTMQGDRDRDLPASDPQAGELLRRDLGSKERAQNLSAKAEQLQKTIRRAQAGNDKFFPKYAEYRSRVENWFGNWIEAFFNAALEYAREEETDYFAMLAADKLAEIWVGHDRGESVELFKRVYDDTARRWGMRRYQSWWVEWTDRLELLEHRGRWERANLGEEIDPPEQWKIHLDTFIKVHLRHMGGGGDPEHGSTEYEAQEGIRDAFNMWLDEVQEDLLNDASWRREVEEHMEEKYDVDAKEWWGLPIDDTEYALDGTSVDDIDWTITPDEMDRLFNPDESLDELQELPSFDTSDEGEVLARAQKMAETYELHAIQAIAQRRREKLSRAKEEGFPEDVISRLDQVLQVAEKALQIVQGESVEDEIRTPVEVTKDSVAIVREWITAKRQIDELNLQLTLLSGNSGQVSEKLLPVVRELHGLKSRIDHAVLAIQRQTNNQQTERRELVLGLLETLSKSFAIKTNAFHKESVKYLEWLKLESDELKEAFEWLTSFNRRAWNWLRKCERAVAELEQEVFYA